MSFYKLYCLIYRRTDYYKLDRIRRKLMYPEYYEEHDKRISDKLMELMHIKKYYLNMFNSLNHERYDG